MMIPQVARKLIGMVNPYSKWLFDPFCGTGTSLVEGALADFSVCGTDLNPLARLISNVKTRDYDMDALQQSENRLQNMLKELSEVEISQSFNQLLEEEREKWNSWFPEETLVEIGQLTGAIDELNQDDSTDLMRISLSNSLRRVSFQRNHEFKLYRIPVEERESFSKDLLPVFKNELQMAVNGIRHYQNRLKAGVEVEIHSFNTVETVGKEYHYRTGKWVDAVVTSPPYGDSSTTVAYAQYSWLSNRILGLDNRVAGALDRELMGGSKADIVETGCTELDLTLDKIEEIDSSRAQEVMAFYLDYQLSINNVSSMMTPGAFSGYVVGNRTVKGVKLPTDIFTAWCFENNGFNHKETIVRKFPMKRMPYETSPSNIEGKKSPTMKEEYIIICEAER